MFFVFVLTDGSKCWPERGKFYGNDVPPTHLEDVTQRNGPEIINTNYNFIIILIFFISVNRACK